MDRVRLLKSEWDRVCAVGLAIAAVIVLILGWFGVSGTPYPAAQLPYIISAGIGGLFLIGVSTALWLSADLRDEWRKLDRIEQAIRATNTEPGEAEWFSEPDADAADTGRVNDPTAGERTGELPRFAAGHAR